MARTSYYDDNRNRRYPLLSTDAIEQGVGAELPNSVLLDAGFNLCAYSGFIQGTHSVVLHALEVSGDNLLLTCRSDAPGLAGNDIVFSVPTDSAAEYQTVFADATGLEAGGNPDNCTNQLLWYGFLTLGDVAAAVAWATDNPGTPDPDKHTFEPALIQDTDRTYVRSVSLANRERTKTTDEPGATKSYLVAARCLTGAIKFREGHNCQISYSTSANGLIIAAIEGAGAGSTCSEVPQFDGETPPDSGSLLSGGPTCRETIRSVNGVTGPAVRLTAGPGISIERDANDASLLRIVVDVSKVRGRPDGGLL